jgi:hypothetical protein
MSRLADSSAGDGGLVGLVSYLPSLFTLGDGGLVGLVSYLPTLFIPTRAATRQPRSSTGVDRYS